MFSADLATCEFGRAAIDQSVTNAFGHASTRPTYNINIHVLICHIISCLRAYFYYAWTIRVIYTCFFGTGILSAIFKTCPRSIPGIFTIFTISGLLCRGLIGISPNVSVLLAGIIISGLGSTPIRPRHNSPEIVNIVNSDNGRIA